MASDVPKWFRAVVGEGIQRLVAIGLPGGPGYDSMKLTAQAWAEALWDAPVDWHESVDSARLASAFKRAGRAERWPSPKQVLEMMPKRPQPRALPPRQPSRQEREKNRQHVEAMVRQFGGRTGGTRG